MRIFGLRLLIMISNMSYLHTTWGLIINIWMAVINRDTIRRLCENVLSSVAWRDGTW
jgi:hypothetical protein